MANQEKDPGDWHPISSADRCGMLILGWGTILPGSTQKMYGIMRYDGCWLIDLPMSNCNASRFYPTHWMGLPPPPNNEQVDT